MDFDHKSIKKMTPMMEQYFSIKEQYPDTLLLFRMGDFYELFFDDARKAAKILNIALTHRGKLDNHPIPMAGIPHHAAQTYIDRITNIGLRAAICEQVEDPKLSKGIVKRAVTQVVSPGLPYDLEKNEQGRNHYIACAYEKNQCLVLVLLDFITGEFFGTLCQDESELTEKIESYAPKEFISYLGQWDHFLNFDKFLEARDVLVTYLDQKVFTPKFAKSYIEQLIPFHKEDQVLKKKRAIFPAVGGLSFYICSTQGLDQISHIRPFRWFALDTPMILSQRTLVGLEILPRSKERSSDCLLSFIDRTQTTMGTRRLKRIILQPTRCPQEITSRLDLIHEMTMNIEQTKQLREDLATLSDLDRLLTKVATGRSLGSDLLAIAQGIMTFQKIVSRWNIPSAEIFPQGSAPDTALMKLLVQEIQETICDEIGASLEKGNLIRPGQSKKRDDLAKKAFNVKSCVKELETKWQKETSLSKLRIKNNNIAGYFVEVSKAQAPQVPAEFVRRQTLVNSERFSHPKLEEFEKDLVTSLDKLLKLERVLFQNLVDKVMGHKAEIQWIAEYLAAIDVIQSLAWTSFQESFCRPVLKQEGKGFELKGVWHPLIKKQIGEQFVPHHFGLDDKNFFALITGPNMAGKTTVMREVAISYFLTQIGCYVPAQCAEIAPCDFLFCRLGAGDDIMRGQSTFMVEMSETAEILRHAGPESLILLDEIGRGTSTYDGLSIAWALMEYITEKIQATTLFSTHYHELIEVAAKLKGAKNFTVKTLNKDGEIRFLYELIPGGAKQSFGIHVAKLAGLPREILHRSQELLLGMEDEKEFRPDQSELTEAQFQNLQLSFFSQEKPYWETLFKDLQNDIENLDLNKTTPIEAWQKLEKMRDSFQGMKH